MNPVTICPHCGHRILPNLTERQERLMATITTWHRTLGHAPSMSEIAAELRVNATVAQREVQRLLRAGHLRRAFPGARNLFPVATQ